MASAMSSSIRRAQIPSLCHLCESSPNIKWKCVDCDLLMCTNCKQKVHSKFKSSTEHKIITIKEVGSTSEDDLTNIQTEPCEKHRKRNYSMYCSTCCELVCVDCIASLHKKHDFEPLETIYNMNVNKLKFYDDLIQNEMLPFLLNDTKRIEKEGIDEVQRFKDAKSNLIDQQNEIKRKVDKLADTMLKELEHNLGETQEKFAENHRRNQKMQVSLKSQIDLCKDALKSSNIIKVMQAVSKMETAVQDHNYRNKLHRAPPLEFLKGDISEDSITDMLGTLQKSFVDEMRINLVKTYDSDLHSFGGISVCSNDSAWVFDNTVDTSAMLLSHMKLDSKIKTIKQFKSMDIIDITLLPTGDLILSLYDQSTIQRLTVDGKMEPFIDVSPCLPRGVHVNRSNKILVGMRECGLSFPVTNDSIRQITIFDQKGRTQKNIRYDTSGQNIFSLPMRITVNINGDLCVADRLNDEGMGRVLVLEPSGKLRWKYDGNNDSMEFYPVDIATTLSGNIVCSDMNTHKLHVLNMDGKQLMIQDTKEFELTYPHSLDIDSKGLLWVGSSTAEDSKENAKLVIFEIHGF